MKFASMNKGMNIQIFLVILLSCFAAEAADWDKKVVFEPISISSIEPLEVVSEQLKPGLTVVYYQEFFERHLQFLPKTESSRFTSFRGKPIKELNHNFGNEKVFDSGSSRGVGMRLEGFMHFREKGTYDLQALSNDGIIMYISNVLALNDPEQHSDRLSNLAHVSVDKPGYYPVLIEYFQRKGTATLQLLWKTPGSATMVPVPAQAYAHLP
jgi:hypothetical protein